jgi:hypothetical protein
VFQAEIEAAELDDRARPGPVFEAITRELSRSHLVVTTRRMCYIGRVLVMAIHRIDDRPVPLMGRVVTCDYEIDGLYRVDLDLMPIPPQSNLRQWADSRAIVD